MLAMPASAEAIANHSTAPIGATRTLNHFPIVIIAATIETPIDMAVMRAP
jgi:hypothetical protein